MSKKMVIGSFGAAMQEAQAEPDEIKVFEFYGEEIEIDPNAGMLPFMKLASVHESGEVATEQQAMAAMYETLQSVLTPAGFQRFYHTALKHKMGQDGLIEVLNIIFTANQEGARPLEQDSDLQDSPSTDGKNTRQKFTSTSQKRHATQLEKARQRQERKAALAAQLAALDEEEDVLEDEDQEEEITDPLKAPLTPVSELSRVDWAEIKGASVMGAGK